jgi:hypothetical protein
MALQDGFKVTELTILRGGGGWGADTTGNLTMRSPGTHIDIGTGFTGTYGTDGSGVIDEVAITAAGKNYSSGSWSYDPVGSAIATTSGYGGAWDPSRTQVYTSVLLSGVTNDTNNRIGFFDNLNYFQVLTYDTSAGSAPPYITGATGWRTHPDGSTPTAANGTSIYNVQAGTALPGEYCSIGISGTGSGSFIFPTIGQTEEISMDDMSVEFGNASETADITIHELYEDFSSVAGGDPIRHDLLDHKPNFDWFQGGPASSSTFQEYQSHPIRFDEFYGATYDAYGGEGCLGIGTPITMADGTTKNIEDLNIGDWVRAATVPGMPLDFDEEDTWSEWTGTPHGNPPGSVWATAYYDIQEINRVTPASASIQNIYFDYYDNYYLINGSLKATYEHPFFIIRDGSYQFKTTVSLQPGDKLFKINNEFEEILSVEFVNEPLETVNFDVESLDVYFGGGYLMHNVHGK